MNCNHSTRELVCYRCDLARWDSKGREVECGDPRDTGVTLRDPPKHRGQCGQVAGIAGNGPGSVQVQRKRRRKP
jgi:hypothetical protein